MDANKTVLILYLRENDCLKEAYIQKLLDVMQHYARQQYISGEKEIIKVLTRINLDKIERVILMTSDIMGPIHDLGPVFEKSLMDEVDFWGIAKHNGEIFPHFIVFEKKALSSLPFRKVLNECKEYFEFVDRITNCLRSIGLQERFHIVVKKEKSPFIERVWETKDFIVKYKSPFLCKDIFEQNSYVNGGDETARSCFSYIGRNSGYDTNLIWDYLLHTKNVFDIKNLLQLEYIVPSNRNLVKRENYYKGQAAIIVHLYYKDLLDECFDYLKLIPGFYDIYIVSSNDELLERARNLKEKYYLNNINLLQKENRGRDFSALLVTCRDILLKYEFLCFLHDKKSHDDVHPAAGRTWMNNMWENILKNGMFVRNVLDILKKNPRLGLLVPPEPFQANKVYLLGNTWGKNFNNTIKFLDELKVEAVLDRTKPPIALSGAFWCRTKALIPLFNKKFTYDYFPKEPMEEDGTICHAMERSLPYIAQSQGFYTAILTEQDYASLRSSRLQQLLMNTMRYLYDEQLEWDIQTEYTWRQPIFCFMNFASRHDKCFIFGNTEYTQICLEFLIKLKIKIDGIIFSDGCEHGEDFNGIPIRCISELKEEPDKCGIIFAMGEKEAEKDLNILRSRDFTDFLFFLNSKQQKI